MRNRSEAPDANTGESEKLPENVVILERPEARYRLIYETHPFPHKPEEISRPDGLALEHWGVGEVSFATGKDAENLAENYWKGQIKEAKGDRTELEHVINNGIPVFFVDLIDPFQKAWDRQPFLDALRSLETVIAAGAIGYSAKKIKDIAKRAKENEPISRREFFKLSGGALAGIYTGTNLLDFFVNVSRISNIVVKKKHLKVGPYERRMENIHEKIHPEVRRSIDVTLRNAVWAQKLQTIAGKLSLQSNHRPELAMYLGSLHWGLEDMLAEEPAKRLESIKGFMKSFFTKEDGVSISTVARLDFSRDQNRWIATDIFNDPELAKIEKSLGNK